MKSTFLFLSFFISANWVFSQAASNSATGLNYATVQLAINASVNNYTVFVTADEVNGGITINGKTNLTVTRAANFPGTPLLKSSTLGSSMGFQVVTSRSVTFSNLCIAEYGQGIGLYCESNRVDSCLIRSNTGYGIFMTAVASRGNLLTSNTITAPNGYSGIEMNTTASNNTAISNHVYGSRYGATVGEFGPTASNVLINNNFDENWDIGVKIGPSPAIANVLSGNWIHSSGGNAGVSLTGGSLTRFYSNTITGQDSGVSFTAASNLVFFSNFISGQQSATFSTANLTNSVIVYNELTAYPGAGGMGLGGGSIGNLLASNYAHDSGSGADGFGVGGLNATNNTLLSNTVVNVDSGLWVTANANTIQQNLVRGASMQAILILNATNNLINANTFQNNSAPGAVLFRAASGNTFKANNVASNSGDGVVLSNGINNFLTGNTIQVSGGKGVWLYAETNTFVGSNSINNNLVGLQTDWLTQNPKIIMNDILFNTQANLTNLVGATYYAVSNYFGPGSRAFSQKKISVSGPFTADPWLNGSVGVNGDFVIPLQLASAVASNGLASQVNLHWGPTAAIPDFASYQIYRTQTSNAYSNLTDSDLLTQITAASVTNYVDSPVAGGYYYYYITAKDTNGCESWYSPQATVNYVSNDAPIASFTGPGPWITNQIATFVSTSFAGTGTITNYLWRFGDGSSSVGPAATASHNYPTPLTNYVSLTIFNNLGQSNAVSNLITVYPLFPLSGTMSGTVLNGVTMNLASFATQMVTNTAASTYQFVVSNDTYTVTPSKLGYRFQPASRSVVIFNNGSTTNGFTSSDIYPQLVLSNLREGDKIKRDMPLLITSDAPEILSTISYTVSNLSPSNHFSATYVKPYGQETLFDTTLQPDGDYRITATAVDTVFLRTHTTNLTVTFDNGLFKILDKNLENLKAIAYDTIRRPAKGETLELYFYIKENQKMKINFYNKLGRTVLSYGEKDYFHGHNRLALDLPIALPSGPYYAVFECKEWSKTVLFVVSQ